MNHKLMLGVNKHNHTHTHIVLESTEKKAQENVVTKIAHIMQHCIYSTAPH